LSKVTSQSRMVKTLDRPTLLHFHRVLSTGAQNLLSSCPSCP
jgi:hypothetical protein